MTHSPLFSSARVCTPPLRSEPAPGSVSARAASLPLPVAALGRKFCLSSSEPKRAIGAQPRALWAAIARAVLPQPQPSCSIAIAALTASTPAPPYSSATLRPSSPNGPIFLAASQLNWLVSSTSLACGLTSLATKSWTVSRQRSCSSDKSKFIWPSLFRRCNNNIRTHTWGRYNLTGKKLCQVGMTLSGWGWGLDKGVKRPPLPDQLRMDASLRSAWQYGLAPGCAP